MREERGEFLEINIEEECELEVNFWMKFLKNFDTKEIFLG